MISRWRTPERGLVEFGSDGASSSESADGEGNLMSQSLTVQGLLESTRRQKTTAASKIQRTYRD